MQTPSKLPSLPVGSVTAPQFEDDWVAYAVWMLDHHPAIYIEFRKLIDRRLKRFPDETVSSRMALEVLRWETSLRASGDAFKINNNILPLLSRLYISERPHTAANFRLRRSTYDTWQNYPEIVEAFNRAKR
jgi:hypothetical protein